MTPPPSLVPYATFGDASRAALGVLQGELGMGLWVVTRASGDDWIILSAANREHRYAVAEGDVYRWSDSLCARMVAGNGPPIAASTDEVAAYRDAPIARALAIGAYLGMPLRTGDGELFGTLCAIDPAPQPGLLGGVGQSTPLPLLELVGRLLATVLDRDLGLEAHARRAERAEAAAMVDELTGLWNRRAWERFRVTEEARCQRYGSPACVLSIDLDGLKIANDSQGHAAGDQLLRAAAKALSAGIREQDIVARLGGDEFGVLLVECPEDAGRAVEERLRQELGRAQVAASIGFARRDPQQTLEEAWERADAAMYAQKRLRKEQRAPG